MSNTIDWLHALVFISTRFSVLIIFSPIAPINYLPLRVKVFLVFSISLLMIGNITLISQHLSPLDVLIKMSFELINGLVLSMSVFAAFAVFDVAGFLIDNQMGLSASSVFNPHTNSHTPIIGHLYHLLAGVIFFSTNTHHLLFKVLLASLQQIPPGKCLITMGLSPALKQFSQLFMISLMMASPIIFTLMIIDIICGLITRNMPQINVFFITIPIKIAFGLILMSINLNSWQELVSVMLNKIILSWQGFLS